MSLYNRLFAKPERPPRKKKEPKRTGPLWAEDEVGKLVTARGLLRKTETGQPLSSGVDIYSSPRRIVLIKWKLSKAGRNPSVPLIEDDIFFETPWSDVRSYERLLIPPHPVLAYTDLSPIQTLFFDVDDDEEHGPRHIIVVPTIDREWISLLQKHQVGHR